MKKWDGQICGGADLCLTVVAVILKVLSHPSHLKIEGVS